MFTAVLYTPKEILVHKADHLNALLGTFLTGNDSLHYGDSLHRTLHARVFASTRSDKASGSVHEAEAGKLGPPPRHWRELATHPRGEHFKAATMLEIRKAEDMKLWKRLKRTPSMFVLPLKWVFTDKYDENNDHVRCKARICVRGDKQHVNSLASTYAATLAARSFRIVMALVAYFGWEVRQFDVVNAFLNALFEEGSEPIYVEYPPGYEQEGYVLQLLKASLRQT